MNNIPEIRDIHLPDGVSMFPLAYGWWVILGSVVILFLTIKLISWIIKTSKKHYALKRLKNISIEHPVSAAVEISELLRRICYVKYKDASVLYGKEWVDFLNNHSKSRLEDSTADLLIYAPFMNEDTNTYSQQTANKLKNFCKNWIGENL